MLKLPHLPLLAVALALAGLVACSGTSSDTTDSPPASSDLGTSDPLPAQPTPPAAPSASAAAAPAPTAVPSPTPAELERQALEITRQATVQKFPEWLKSHAPSGTTVEFVVNITPPDAPADRMRFRIQAQAESPDALTGVLRSQTDVVEVEFIASQDGRVLLDATLRLDPSH